MNRIKELREAAGLSAAALAKAVGTSRQQIYRLEDGERPLTVGWMQRIARVLECDVIDLISTAVLAIEGPDVEPYDIAAVSNALASKGLRTYRVIGDSVAGAGIAPGETITVDETQVAIDIAASGAIVLVEIAPTSILVLRQLVRPNLITTNRVGTNVVIRLDDVTVQPRVKGVVIPA